MVAWWTAQVQKPAHSAGSTFTKKTPSPRSLEEHEEKLVSISVN
jgi:hypothetical protein